MMAPFPPSLICPVLVSREPQLGALDRLVDLANTGHGHTVLISGEAGVGKSRLAAEVMQRVRRRRWQDGPHEPHVLLGRCFEPDHALPYAPLRDLLRGDLAGHAPDTIALALAQWRHSSPACCPNTTRCSPISRPFLRSTQRKIGVGVLMGRSHS
jgi:predicted ATPase